MKARQSLICDIDHCEEIYSGRAGQRVRDGEAEPLGGLPRLVQRASQISSCSSTPSCSRAARRPSPPYPSTYSTPSPTSAPCFVEARLHVAAGEPVDARSLPFFLLTRLPPRRRRCLRNQQEPSELVLHTRAWAPIHEMRLETMHPSKASEIERRQNVAPLRGLETARGDGC